MTSLKLSKIFLRKDKQTGNSPVAVSACLYRSAAGAPLALPRQSPEVNGGHKKTAYEIIPKPLTVNWWNQQGSNLRPGDYELSISSLVSTLISGLKNRICGTNV